MIFKSTIDCVVNWHKETFPDATKEEQLKKLEEELNEFYQDLHNMELADVLICAIVLIERFKSPIGRVVFNGFANHPDFYPSLDEIISKKIQINKSRTWQKIDGVYRHVESVDK